MFFNIRKYSICFILLLSHVVEISAQVPTFKQYDIEYYRNHPYPDYVELQEYIHGKYDFGNTQSRSFFYEFAKAPDGYYIYEHYYDSYNQSSSYKNFTLCWSLETGNYIPLSFKRRESDYDKPIIQQNTSFKEVAFYNYPNWYNDVIKLYGKVENLNCNESAYLARAYDMKSNNILFGNDNALSYNDALYGKKRTKEELQEIMEYRWLAIKYFGITAQACPEKPSIVGTARFKLRCIYMAFYYDLMLLGYKQEAQEFLDKSYFDPFYVSVGKNLLNQCEPNGIIFLGGDADTYVCVYVQEKLNFRRDVTIINTSLANTGWYIDYLVNDLKDTRKVNASISIATYCDPITDVAYKSESSSDKLASTLSFNKVAKAINERSSTVIQKFNGKSYLTLPSFMLKSGQYLLNFSSSSSMYRYEIFLSDLIDANPLRPFYFSKTMNSNDYKGVSNNIVAEGLTYKLDLGYYPDKMNGKNYEKNIMNNMFWEGMSSKYFLMDEDKLRFVSLYRMCFSDYVNTCSNDKQNVKLVAAAEKMLTVLPDSLVPFDYNIATIVKLYYPIGNKVMAENAANACYKTVDKLYKKYEFNHANKESSEICYLLYNMYYMAKSLSEIEGYSKAKEMGEKSELFLKWLNECK